MTADACGRPACAFVGGDFEAVAEAARVGGAEVAQGVGGREGVGALDIDIHPAIEHNAPTLFLTCPLLKSFKGSVENKFTASHAGLAHHTQSLRRGQLLRRTSWPPSARRLL